MDLSNTCFYFLCFHSIFLPFGLFEHFLVFLIFILNFWCFFYGFLVVNSRDNSMYTWLFIERLELIFATSSALLKPSYCMIFLYLTLCCIIICHFKRTVETILLYNIPLSHLMLYLSYVLQLHWKLLLSIVTHTCKSLKGEKNISFRQEPPSFSNPPKWPTQRERGEAPSVCLLGLLENRVVSLATCMGIYKKGDTVDIEAMGTVHKGMALKCYLGKTGGVYSVAQHAAGSVVNGQDSHQEN